MWSNWSSFDLTAAVATSSYCNSLGSLKLLHKGSIAALQASLHVCYWGKLSCLLEAGLSHRVLSP
jgi:hypothetical protein